MSEHTPGPWKQDGLLVIHEGDIVAGVWGHSDERYPEGIANARLIATSPRMAEALARVYRFAKDADLPGPVYLSIEEFTLIRNTLAEAGLLESVDAETSRYNVNEMRSRIGRAIESEAQS